MARTWSVPGGKTSELLVRLALDAGLVVRTDLLIDDLWAASAVDTRRNTLQSKVAKLRRALGDPELIVSGDDGYKLAVEPHSVDALAVLDHAASATRLLDERGRTRRGRPGRVSDHQVPRGTAVGCRRRRLD